MILMPFVASLAAEELGGSGILAAVTAGLCISLSGVFRHLNVSARMQTISFWTTLTFVFNGAIFVMLGLQLPDIIRAVPPELRGNYPVIQPILIVVALTACLIGLRFIWIWTSEIVTAIIARLKGRAAETFGFRVRLAGSVAGVRGAITLAGILSLPLAMRDGSPFPARDLVIFLAAGVIICSLLVATVALPRWGGGVGGAGGDAGGGGERRARGGAGGGARARRESGAGEGGAGGDGAGAARLAATENLIAGYRRRIAAADDANDLRAEAREAGRLEREMRLAAIEAERLALRDMFRSGEINDHTLQALFSEITLSEALLNGRQARK